MSESDYSSIVNFEIESIDPLAQGVSKINDKITFIPKTLPGEEGTAQVKKTKGVLQFATLKDISIQSPDRIEPECPHFEKCNGCHYLHTSYDIEKILKISSFNQLLTRNRIDFDFSKVEFIKAKSRFNYRNRIQLHYDKIKNLIGFFDESKNIIEIPTCLLPNSKVKEKLNEVYKNKKQFLKAANKKKGHFEIYDFNGSLKTSFDLNYANEGFSQVNKEMNTQLVQQLKIWSDEMITGEIIDLFGGEGNLSSTLSFDKRYVVDVSPKTKSDELNQFISANLYKEGTFSQLKNILPKSADLWVLDPPRSGFKNIDQYFDFFEVKNAIYVSCNPQTLLRDLSKVSKTHRIELITLLDFFPSTFHFETVVKLSKRVDL